jgi:hypothetical protein
MNYKIIAAHLECTKNKLSLVAVLWQSNDDGSVRASYCTTAPLAGYTYITANDVLNDALLQKVAGAGMNLPDKLKKKYFSEYKNWEK